MIRTIWVSAILAGTACHAAYAADTRPSSTDTLQKIKARGLIVVGHRESSVPFSYLDNDQKVVGYSQEYSNAIIDAVKKQLGLPDLTVKMVPITSSTRIPLLQNGSIDFECGSTTNNAERQQQVAFSNSIFIVGGKLLVRKESGIGDFNDLAGKPVVTTAGTTNEILLNQLNDKNAMKMRIISAKDHSDAFRTLESGRAVAFYMDDPLLAGERAKAKRPDQWVIVGTPQSHEAYGCMLRKSDPAFKQLMDSTIAQAQTQGDAETWYQRWFTQPIPPKNINMNFEMSAEMKALFNAPNDHVL
ncbi:glutamate/aspartate ABC transporter substrate-binding protein [Lonsdalea quercina]|uniref:glutamate/aspartate ABC transporter substrate-binding protein n=1 Tax=Lonsdalea quercina TaxID=71657 RepID=UPI003977135C